MNIETSKISRGLKCFTVENIDGIRVKVENKQVEDILKDVNIEEKEIVILLATIQETKKLATTKNTRHKKVDDEVATKAIINLIKNYNIEKLISTFEEIKYYQIKKILESDSPVRELEEYI